MDSHGHRVKLKSHDLEKFGDSLNRAKWASLYKTKNEEASEMKGRLRVREV